MPVRPFFLPKSAPLPYQRCYCSICRKTGGGGGYIVNIEADAKTLEVTGKEHVAIYRAMTDWHRARGLEVD